MRSLGRKMRAYEMVGALDDPGGAGEAKRIGELERD
jgi:hypothetical protein